MAQDYSTSKGPLGSVFPVNASDSSNVQRLEPIVTPQKLKDRYLFGIPMVSAIKDPITGKRQILTDDMIKDYIDGAIIDAEEMSQTIINPTQFNEKYPFDRNDYLSFGYLRLNKRPVYSIDEMMVTPANNVDVFQVPLDWVETNNLVMGQVNLIPIGIALNGTVYGLSLIHI